MPRGKSKTHNSVKDKDSKLSRQSIRDNKYFKTGFIFVIGFAAIGAISIIRSFAATPTTHFETEQASLTTCASTISDTNASSNQAVLFECAAPPPTVNTYGATLPITYDVATIPATAKYVAPNGSATAACGATTPCTLARAISASTSGGTIIVRGGTYRDQGKISTGSKSLTIRAYSGEIPTFNGARQVTGGWVDAGAHKYIPYTPTTNSTGISNFIAGQGVVGGASGAGRYSDQAWIGDTQLKQVTSLSALNSDGNFFVDATNNRLYLTSADAGKSNIEVFQRGRFLEINGQNSVFEGIRITRYSDSGGDYGVILVYTNGDNLVMKNVEFTEIALIPLFVAGTSDHVNNVKIQNVTIDRSNWMGASVGWSNNFQFDSNKVTNIDPWDEYTSSPVSGGIKFGKAWDTKITNNYLDKVSGHGFWWDDSNYRTTVANNNMTNIAGSAIFYEVSDDLLVINNLITLTSGSGQAFKLAAASGVKLVNNTVIGGKDQVGLYTDNRSMPPPGTAPCYDSSRGEACGLTEKWPNNWDLTRTRPTTMDWKPRIDLMINNIFANPTGSGFCGSGVLVCITTKHNEATYTYVPLEQIIHKANFPHTGLPQTLFNGNVYDGGSLVIQRYNPATNSTSIQTFKNGSGAFDLSVFRSAMAAAISTPSGGVDIPGFETNGITGTNLVNRTTGVPSSGLAAQHNNAFPIPSNTLINQYIPAGTRHYGVTYR